MGGAHGMTIGHFASGVVAATEACAAGVSTIPDLFEFNFNPTNSYVGARWNTDGTIESYSDTSVDSWGAIGGGPWIGNCPANRYEYRWTKTGDFVDNFTTAENVWTDASSVELSVETQVLINGNQDSTVTFELRRASDQIVILTDTFQLRAQVVFT